MLFSPGDDLSNDSYHIMHYILGSRQWIEKPHSTLPTCTCAVKPHACHWCHKKQHPVVTLPMQKANAPRPTLPLIALKQRCQAHTSTPASTPAISTPLSYLKSSAIGRVSPVIPPAECETGRQSDLHTGANENNNSKFSCTPSVRSPPTITVHLQSNP